MLVKVCVWVSNQGQKIGVRAGNLCERKREEKRIVLFSPLLVFCCFSFFSALDP
jgi:hypothetical protein